VSESYARLEWIVVSHLHRGRGIGGALLEDFLERMRAEEVRAVSTGFFRPAFFARFGFGVDPRYPGLVKILEPAADTSK
jgi:predicted N-acetyltransferase YhbS